MPQVQSPSGMATLKTIQVGDQVASVFSQQTAIKATIIR
jgi:hypothetical protein